MRFARPATLTEAITLRAEGMRVLAGGTDLYPAAGQGLGGQDLAGDVLDLTAIADLSGLQSGPEGLRIGACTTWTDLAEAALPPPLTALQQAARLVGGRQVQNAGTLGGNLCNASPAADGVPPLLVLDARVEITGQQGRRDMALADFLIGPRRTALAPDELLTAVILPAAALQGRSAFVKLGARAHLVISIAMAAARVTLEGGRITHAALAVGACGPVARRVPGLEARLRGQTPAEAAALLTPDALAEVLAPIDDIRATAAYRVEAAAELLRRAVEGACR